LSKAGEAKKNHIVAPQEQLSLDISKQFKNNLLVSKLNNLNLRVGTLKMNLDSNLLPKNNLYYFNSNLVSFMGVLKLKKSI